jgi:hypothetical protein
MRNASLGVMLFFAAGAVTAQTPSVASALPGDVQAIAERIALCEHFSGEFNGDGSDHDRYVNSQMDQLRCGDSLDMDVRAIKNKYTNNPIIMKALESASAAFKAEEPTATTGFPCGEDAIEESICKLTLIIDDLKKNGATFTLLDAPLTKIEAGAGGSYIVRFSRNEAEDILTYEFESRPGQVILRNRVHSTQSRP